MIGHRGHECETIQATLDRMVPQLESNVKYIEDKLQVVNRLVPGLVRDWAQRT